MKTRQDHNLSILLLFTAAIMMTTGCGTDSRGRVDSRGELHGSISISGAFALYPMTVKWAEEFMKENPGTRVDISAGGAGKGMTDALAGMVDLGMFSREITQAETDKGAWHIAVAKDAVLPTISASNPVLPLLKQHGMTRKDFQVLFLKDKNHHWEEFFEGETSTKINVYTRSDACGAAEMWGKYLGENQESLQGIGVYGDPGMADAIKNDANGLGYNNVVYAYDMNSRMIYDGLEVIPLDIDEDGKISPEEDFYGTLDQVMEAIRTGTYPSPPARELYFVANGKPDDPVVIAFLAWILTEGQNFVGQAGYVKLPEDKTESELRKLTP
jgi:phosphate transport system substrate-binding protein